MDDSIEPVLSTGPLLLIAAGAVVLLLFLIIRLRLHAFVALILTSLLTALATGLPIADIVQTLVDGFGSTLGSVALLVGLGAILGALLEADASLTAIDQALVVIAIASGATVLSHVNDSGFWLVGRFLGMDENTTFKTWTVMVTLLGGIAFAFAWGLSLVP